MISDSQDYFLLAMSSPHISTTENNNESYNNYSSRTGQVEARTYKSTGLCCRGSAACVTTAMSTRRRRLTQPSRVTVWHVYITITIGWWLKMIYI